MDNYQQLVRILQQKMYWIMLYFISSREYYYILSAQENIVTCSNSGVKGSKCWTQQAVITQYEQITNDVYRILKQIDTPSIMHSSWFQGYIDISNIQKRLNCSWSLLLRCTILTCSTGVIYTLWHVIKKWSSVGLRCGNANILIYK